MSGCGMGCGTLDGYNLCCCCCGSEGDADEAAEEFRRAEAAPLVDDGDDDDEDDGGDDADVDGDVGIGAAFISGDMGAETRTGC